MTLFDLATAVAYTFVVLAIVSGAFALACVLHESGVDRRNGLKPEMGRSPAVERFLISDEYRKVRIFVAVSWVGAIVTFGGLATIMDLSR